MIYCYNDVLKYIPDLNLYVQSKVKNDWWKDIVQDTLIYLFIKFDKLIITNLKGIIFNTANFFINNYFYKLNKKLTYITEIKLNLLYNISEIKNPVFKINDFNTYIIDDKILYNLKTVSKLLFIPFSMQLENKSINEIALNLNLNKNTIKTRIKRCKEYLSK